MIQRFRARKTSQGRRSRRGARGAAAVEFALIVSLVLAPLLVGMIQTGWSLYNAMSITGAVRDGARFAATGDASTATWANDVNTQVRTLTFAATTTQANQTSVCVELYKQGTGAVKSQCNVVSGVGPNLTLPADDSWPAPVTGLGLTSGQCAVRVIAARDYKISFILGSVSQTMTRGSVARYERGSC